MATEYDISRPAGQCVRCARVLGEGEEYVAVLTEQGESFQRGDWCLGCWDAPDRGEVASLFGVWRTRMPRKQPKRKLFIDDAMLVNFFERLSGEKEPARVNFRFVLALILMRKKLLVYERTEKPAPPAPGEPNGPELWIMRLRGAEQRHEVVDPHLDETTIGQVSAQLSEILQGEI